MVLDDPYYQKPPPERGESILPPLESRLASPLDRLAAVVADFLIFSPVVAVLIAPFRRYAVEADLLGLNQVRIQAIASASFISISAFIIYRTLNHAWIGATPGQRAFKIEVVSIWTGERPRFLEAFLRAVIWCFDLLTLAPLAALFANEKRRPLHDRAADTVVVTKRKKRAVPPPSIPEMSMAGGFQSAVLAFTVIALGAHFLRPSAFTKKALTAELETAEKLCREVGNAHASGQESRIETALILFGAGELDADCLREEAQLSLWANTEKTEGRALAYLAQGLVSEVGSSVREDYFTQACPNPLKETDVCRSVELWRSLDKRTGALETKLERLTSEIDTTSPLYLKIWTIASEMEARHFGNALRLMDGIPPRKELGLFLARGRAQAHWEIGEPEKARTVFQASIPLLSSETHRVDFAQWFCRAETLTGECGKQSSCKILKDSVDQDPDLLSREGVSLAFVRAEVCLAGGQIDSQKADEMAAKIPEKLGREFVRAMAKIETAEGRESLTKVASARDDEDPFYLEANLKIADLAEAISDLEPVLERWKKLDDGSETKRILGLKLSAKLAAFQDWEAAFATAMTVARGESVQLPLLKLLVVAAHRSGHDRIAREFLFRNTETRRPASLSSEAKGDVETNFETVARELNTGGTP